VALESCEFWSAFCEAAVDSGPLRPFLGRLIPVLLKNMVYDEYDEEVSEAEATEEAVLSGTAQTEEREQDIRPFHPKCDPCQIWHAAVECCEFGGGGAGEKRGLTLLYLFNWTNFRDKDGQVWVKDYGVVPAC